MRKECVLVIASEARQSHREKRQPFCSVEDDKRSEEKDLSDSGSELKKGKKVCVNEGKGIGHEEYRQ
jgi:hypothetical protein